MPKIITRAEAKALGLKRFFTGKPCKRGHVAERQVGNASCVECAQEYHAANREKHIERFREYRAAHHEHLLSLHREYYLANREQIRKKARLSYSQLSPEKKRQHQEQNKLWATANPDRMRESARKHRAKPTAKQRRREWQKKDRAANPEKYRAQQLQKYWSDPEKFRAKAREWIANNPEKKLAKAEKQREWMAAHPGYYAKKYRENPEKYREKNRRLRAANPEKHREQERRRYAENIEKMRREYKERRARNPEQFREWARKSRLLHIEERRANTIEWRIANHGKTLADKAVRREVDRFIREVLLDMGLITKEDSQAEQSKLVTAYVKLGLINREEIEEWLNTKTLKKA
jgi:hypothetical protein